MKSFSPESELQSLFELSDFVLMQWLAHESPKERNRQAAIELLAESSMLLNNALKNLCGLRVSATADEWEVYDR